jgi:hypothetical protein
MIFLERHATRATLATIADPTTSEELPMPNEKKPEWQQIRDQDRAREAAKTKALRAARMAAEAAAPPASPTKRTGRKAEAAAAR